MSLLQPVAVDRGDHEPEQFSKGHDQRLILLVEGIFEQLVVQVADEVDQAFLAPEPERLVASVKIRDDDSGEILKPLGEETRFAVGCELIAHGVGRREDPDISAPFGQFDLCLVDMDDGALADPVPESSDFWAELLEPFFLALHEVQPVGVDAEFFLEQPADQFVADMVVDVEIHRPGEEVIAEMNAAEYDIIVFHPALRTFAHTRLVFDDPLFDPGARKFQVGLFEALFLFTVVDLFMAAVGAAWPKRRDNDLIRFLRLPDHVAAAQMFDFGAGLDGRLLVPKVDPAPLIVKISGFADCVEVRAKFGIGIEFIGTEFFDLGGSQAIKPCFHVFKRGAIIQIVPDQPILPVLIF